MIDVCMYCPVYCVLPANRRRSTMPSLRTTQPASSLSLLPATRRQTQMQASTIPAATTYPTSSLWDHMHRMEQCLASPILVQLVLTCLLPAQASYRPTLPIQSAHCLAHLWVRDASHRVCDSYCCNLGCIAVSVASCKHACRMHRLLLHSTAPC